MKTNTAVDADEQVEGEDAENDEEAKKSLKKSFANETDDEEC